MTDISVQDDLALLANYKTKQELAYDALREAIITCRFPPGKRLLEVELAQQLGISRSPVREALKRLGYEGLVTEIPHVGATVSEVGLESLHELYLLLAVLEGLACREATDFRLEATLLAMETELEAMDSAINADSYLDWVRHNREFHSLCRKDCPLPHVQRILDDTQDRIHRFQIFRGAATLRAVQSRPEHIAIYQATKERDAQKVELLVRAHYLEGDRAFKEYLRTMPEDPG
ncbi:MAG: GntR family transcriptional regulator [Chloroflexi bacterium]|nr:GntR family transcriptional regulator [Chloroflexota bacterium]MBI3733109.1 GntR family transcriptional regulator [Chloroflexota bacterium]